MPSLFILIPLLGLIILNLPLQAFIRRVAFWFALGIFLTQIALAIFHHPVLCRNYLNETDPFFKTGFLIDHLTFIMLICIGIVSLVSLFVSQHTIFEKTDRFKFINLLIIASIGMSGIVMVKDVFSLYVFLEITAVASFVLIAFQKDIYGLEGSFKYLMLSAIATILMLSAIALLFLTSGSTAFDAIRSGLNQSRANPLIVLAVALFSCGLFIKGGLVPFHGWLPDAYSSAPAPVSVLLAGIVTKAAGVYTLMRLAVSVFGFDGGIKNILLLVGTISIVIGALAALRQKDFKRMLSYSSISQVGYIVVGLGTGTGLGLAGAAFHLFNHSMFKSLLFVNSAAVEKQAGTTDMTKLGGLSSRMPVTGTTSVVALLSACGIPPLAGFWSKIVIIIALWQSALYGYAAIAIIASIITLAYLLYMQRMVFFGKIRDGLEDITEAKAGFTVSSVILAAIIIGTGLFFPMVFNYFLLPIKNLIIR